MPLRVLLADDHDLFADMMGSFIEAVEPGIEFATVRNLHLVRDRLRAGENFDLILLDLNMPGMEGLSGLDLVQQERPGQRVALISGSARVSDMRAAFRGGAVGFLSKTLSGDVFAGALRVMLAGGKYLPEAMLGEASEPAGPADQLTQRESEVFEQLMGGRSNREIADNLGITEVTIKVHMQAIFRKLGAKNRGDAIRIGMTRKGNRT